jgi:nicotinamidase/pyrazinamidase
VVGTSGVDFHPGFDPSAVEAVFHKGHYSAAYSGFEGLHSDDGTSLTDWLRERGVDTVDVVGIATDYCVLATAADAKAAGFTTRVLLDLTAGVAPDSTETAIATMRDAGIAVVR